MSKHVIAVLSFLTLAVAVPAVAVDPNSSSFHLYGGVIFPVVTEFDRKIWFVRNFTTNETSRIDCFPADTAGCSAVGQGHWLVVDGYLAGDGLCGDKPCNILRAVRVQAWNPNNDTWYVIAAPSAP